MNYWIASSNRTNWDIILKELTWGIPKRNKNLQTRTAVGDKLLVFVKQEGQADTIVPSAITGVFAITEIFESNTPLFIPPPQMGDEVFPYRFKLKKIHLFNPPLEFKQLIPDLQFITNKTMWSGHLRTAMRTIPKDDYEFILKIGDQQ